MKILRRSFMKKLGIGASAALVPIAGLADTSKVEDPVTTESIRKFHRTFELAMDRPAPDEVIDLFSEDAEVVFNGGVFKGRSHGVSRLYRERFIAGKSGRRIEPAPGFEVVADPQHDNVELSADLRTATAVFPYSIQVGVPFETESSLAAMARLHGEGVRTWWEGGVYRINYVRDSAGAWKIRRLVYDTLSRADYRPGKRYALPISVPRLASCFPSDPHGPDELI